MPRKYWDSADTYERENGRLFKNRLSILYQPSDMVAMQMRKENCINVIRSNRK